MEAVFQIASAYGEEAIHAAEQVRTEPLLDFGTVNLPLFGETSIGITNWMVTFWIIALVIIVCSIIATHKMKMVPSGLQNLMEWAVAGLTNFFSGVMGKKDGEYFAPMLITFFIFILCSNYSSLLPLAGMVEGFAVPTSYINVTAGFALVTFFCIHVYGVKANRIHYLKHFVSPFAFLLPILLLEEVVKPVALAIRLYGNIYGEEEVVLQLANLIPIGLPVVMQLLGALFGLIQALVFTLLSSIYISTAMGEAH